MVIIVGREDQYTQMSPLFLTMVLERKKRRGELICVWQAYYKNRVWLKLKIFNLLMIRDL